MIDGVIEILFQYLGKSINGNVIEMFEDFENQLQVYGKLSQWKKLGIFYVR